MDPTSLPVNELIVLDFETTGLSPLHHRIIEVGAVRIRNHQVVGEFSKLVNPSTHIPSFVTSLTGINNEMVSGMPKPEEIMPELSEFIEDLPIVAHNASFDLKFLKAEMNRVHIKVNNPPLCTMRLSRRLVPESPNHKLITLASFFNISSDRYHRALDDVLVTAELWRHLYDIACEKSGQQAPSLQFFNDLMKKPKKKVEQFLLNLLKVQTTEATVLPTPL